MTVAVEPKPKKAWYKKWWIWLIIVVVLITGIGVNANKEKELQAENEKPPKTSLDSSAVTEKPEPEPEDLYDGASFAETIEADWLAAYTIKQWSELESDLIPAHFKEFNSTEAGVIEVILDKDFSVFELLPFAKNQIKLIDNPDLEEIILVTPSELVSSNDSLPSKTDKGLENATARNVCETAGKKEFPYEFKPRWIVGVYAETISADDWFFKTDVKLKNEYGTKYQAIMECRVGGSDNKPELLLFDVYQ